MAAAVTGVIGTPAADGAEQAQRLEGPVVLEVGGLAALEAGDAGAPVAVFFCARWVCMALAPRP